MYPARTARKAKLSRAGSRWTRLALVVLIVLVPLACSGSKSGKPAGKAKAVENPYDTYAIHFYLGSGQDRAQVNVPPLGEASFHAAGSSSASATGTASQARGPGMHTQSFIEVPNGGTVDLDPLEQQNQWDPGWILLFGAATECVHQVHSRTYMDAGVAIPPWDATVPKKTSAWYVFPDLDRKFDTCDDVLAHEQIVLCIADQLGSIADAVAPIVWKGPADYTTAQIGGFAQPWTIPPQAKKDRFIARDLAMNALATLARLDAEVVPLNTSTCGIEYMDALGTLEGGGSLTLAEFNRLFSDPTDGILPGLGTPPNQNANPADIETDLRARLELNAHILREGGRLLHHDIGTSVYADMSGAEQQSAAEGDPVRGAMLRWGHRDNGDLAPYNSLAHALRVLFGRWENGKDVAEPANWNDADIPSGDPTCGGVAELDLVQAMDASTSARWEDRRVTTKTQELANSVMARTGLVVPPSALSDASSLRAAIEDELVMKAKRELDPALHVNDPFPQNRADIQEAIHATLAGISDEDLRFAAEQQFTAYRLLTNQSESQPVTAQAGVAFATQDVPPSVAGLQGKVVAVGALKKVDVTREAFSRVAFAGTASECPEHLASPTQLFHATSMKRSMFQNTFAVGDAFRHQLSVVDKTLHGTGNADDQAIADLAGMASAEMRAWTGPGRVVAEYYGPNVVGITAAGFTAADLGATNPTDEGNALFLVYGPPWVADCAAGIRDTCPANFVQDYEQPSALPGIVVRPGGLIQTLQGYDDRGVLAYFLIGGANLPTQFHPDSPKTDSALYIIARHDPADASHGKVLAALSLPPTGTTQYPYVVSESASDYQRQLANAALGLTTDWAVHGDELGHESSSTEPGYCIPGVPRDFFVPLENELTSDSDQFESSWRHYLDLAKQAAARADDLGQKLIDIGIQQDMRREGASESLASTCGDFTILNAVASQGGEVQLPADDDTLKQCVNEDTTDLVFLTNDPVPDVADAHGVGDTDAIKNDILHCSGNNPPDGQDDTLCGRSGELAHGGLNRGDWTGDSPSDPGPDTCKDAVDAVTSVDTGFAGSKLSAWNSDLSLGPDDISAILGAMRVFVKDDGNWHVDFDSVRLMDTVTDSDPNVFSKWPACLGLSNGCDDLGKVLDKIFRTPEIPIGPLNQVQADQLLQNVEGTLWMMAAMTGRLPARVFDVPVPVRNFTTNDQFAAPFVTVYGPQLDCSAGSSNGCTLAENSSAGDKRVFDTSVQALAYVKSTDGNYSFGIAKDDQRPVWLRQVYKSMLPLPDGYDPNAHMWRRAANTPVSFPSQKNVFANFTKWGTALTGVHGNGETCSGSSATSTLTEIRKFKYPDEAGRACPSPNGKHYYMSLYSGSSLLNDIFEYQITESEVVSDIIRYETASDSHGKHGNNNKVLPQGDSCRLTRETDDKGYQYNTVALGCLNDRHFQYPLPPPFGTIGMRFTLRVLLPDSCPPEERVRAFVNSMNPYRTPCDAARELARVRAFTCEMRGQYSALPGGAPLPAINELSDIGKLEDWLGGEHRDIEIALSRIVLHDVPKRVLKDFGNGKIGSGTLAGEHGQLILQYEDQLQSLTTALNDIGQGFFNLQSEIHDARTELNLNDLQKDEALTNIAIERSNMIASMAQQAGSAISGLIPSGNNPIPLSGVPAAIGDGVAMGFEADALTKLGNVEDIKSKEHDATQVKILSDLSTHSQQDLTTIRDALNKVRGSAAEIEATRVALQQNKSKAEYELAKATGADYYKDPISGDNVAIPLNTVLRREYDLTRRRYDEALNDAQRLTYYARLAIEQRIGIRLDDIKEKVGALEAPSVWADDICEFQGIDYSRFRSADVPGIDGGISDQTFGQNPKDPTRYTDPYIGDYVQKLSDFVDYYNIKYPSHEADDETVLSLRDDLLGPQGQCYAPSRNLLVYSHALERAASASDGSGVALGWRTSGCDAGNSDRCLVTLPGNRVEDGQGNTLAGPVDAPTGGFTWLKEKASVDLSQLAQNNTTPLGPSIAPPRSVYQIVHLDAGARYVVSWWDLALEDSSDQAHGALPAVAGSSPAEYRAAVYTPSGAAVGQFTGPPHIADQAQVWSDRHSFQFEAAESGDYVVAFNATDVVSTGTGMGNLAIADVQLETASSATAGASPYEDTDFSRLIPSGNCVAGNPDQFRRAFDYKCEGGACFYELASGFSIDTESLDSGNSKLIGKLAQGNYNFRYIDLALNVVGTGVLDCSKSPSPNCYGTAYLEYTLQHDAFGSRILDYQDIAHDFDFGSASIERGKALAAERFMTIPLGSADQSLVSQPEIQKPEFMGRPLDGVYHLRVYDSPSLVWGQVQDIQLVLKYRYWSRVQRNQ